MGTYKETKLKSIEHCISADLVALFPAMYCTKHLNVFQTSLYYYLQECCSRRHVFIGGTTRHSRFLLSVLLSVRLRTQLYELQDDRPKDRIACRVLAMLCIMSIELDMYNERLSYDGDRL